MFNFIPDLLEIVLFGNRLAADSYVLVYELYI